MGTSNVTTTSITPAEIKFYQDEVTAFQANDGEVYAAANKVLRNIGFNKDRVKAIRIKWRDDEVVSARGRNFDLWYSGGVAGHAESTYCLPCKILPLALAKISITPALKQEYPEVVEKLVRYQLECADVLYNYFFKKEVTPPPFSADILETPLSREELARFMCCVNSSLENFVAGFKNEVSNLAAIIKSQNEVYNKNMLQLTDALSNVRTFTVVNTAEQHQVAKTSPEEKKWLNKAWESAEIISKRNNKSKIGSLKEAYSIVRRNGYDIDKMYKDFLAKNPGKSQISMCAASKELREAMEEAFKELHRKYYPRMYSSAPTYMSTVLISTPQAVREEIQRVADARHIPYNMAAKDVYDAIEEITGCNLKQETKAIADKFGYSHCRKPYVISTNEKYMAALHQIAEEA